MSETSHSTGALPYGPFTAAIRQFLVQLAAMTPEAEAAVVQGYQQIARKPEYQAAERALGNAIARSGRESERDALGGPLLQLVRGDRPSPSEPAQTDPHQSETQNVPSFRPIAEPALSALLAILMQDVLSAELVARLYAPFDHIIPRASLQS